jgi:hypothetical protein
MSNEDLKGSETRLWSLIEQRTRPGADQAEIDRRIWDLFGEEWAIMFTDLSGFSRQVAAFGIIHFLRVGDVDVYGHEVNAASKLGEDTAKAREILVTQGARAALEGVGGLDVTFRKLDVSVAGSDDNYAVEYSV